MVNKFKSLIPLPAIVIAFAILFFGSPASKANAQVAFQAQFATPVGSFGVATGPAPYYAGRPHYGHGHARPYYGAYRHAYRPYRLRRVFLAVPYPHWVYQRVYYAPPPYAYPYGGGY